MMSVSTLGQVPCQFSLDERLNLLDTSPAQSLWEAIPVSARPIFEWGILQAMQQGEWHGECEALPVCIQRLLEPSWGFAISWGENSSHSPRFPLVSTRFVSTRSTPLAAPLDNFFALSSDLLCEIEMPDGNLRVVNPAWERLLGWNESTLLYKRLWDFVHPDDKDSLRTALQNAYQKESEGELLVCQMLQANPQKTASAVPTVRYIQWSFAPSGQGGPLYGTGRDVTENQIREQQILWQLHHDELTGLLTEEFFVESLKQQMAIAARRGNLVGLLYIDLDRFKPINDNFGHDVGDEALRIVSHRLQVTLRAEDVLSRLHGDEFAVLLPTIPTPREAVVVAQKILAAIQTPFTLEGHEMVISASIGVAIAPMDGDTPEQLVKNADTAMYRAKQAGRNGVVLYSSEMDEVQKERFERMLLESHLSSAIERKELQLHYQPLVASKDNRLAGFEALIRWKSEAIGSIAPAKFIPIAEDTGMIIPIGKWVLSEAIAQAKEWQTMGISVQIGVNLSPRQLLEDDLVPLLKQMLQEADLAPGTIDIELTESAFSVLGTKVEQVLRELKSVGVTISVDDFGTGYSSLSYLPRLPVDRVKIDRSFIQNIMGNPLDEAVVRHVIDLAHTLGMEVVAEGVEHADQRQKLSVMGCDILQGYFYGKPVPASEIPLLLGMDSPSIASNTSNNASKLVSAK